MRPREAGPLEALLHERNSAVRRWLIVGGGFALALLVGISGVVAWRQYDDAKHRAVTDLQGRVVAVGALVDASFAGQLSTLASISAAPAVVATDRALMNAYFSRVNPKSKPLFSGGLGWVDRTGRVGASSTNPGSRVSVARRLYFRRVMATGKPYVSAGLIGRRNRQPLVVVAVPTRDRSGHVSGVLVGAILLRAYAESQQARDLGYGNLQIVDRDGQLLLSNLRPVANTALLKQLNARQSGTLTDTAGLDGSADHVVAFARSTVPSWVAVIDRPRSEVFGAARRALILELASLAAATFLVLLVVLIAGRRSRRANIVQNRRARAWSGLTRALGSAGTPEEVSHALRSSLGEAFGGGAIVVALDDDDSPESKARGQERFRELAEPARAGAQTKRLDPADASAAFRAMHSVPIRSADGEVAGTISVITASEQLEPSEWALLESFADLAAHALERARLFAHEHQVALRLQRSLLPDTLPSVDGVQLSGHYRAGGAGVEVGGDWYDAVRRPDGIVQLCVGDVSGRGIDAAVMMGRQRTTFYAYANDVVSPREIVQRMLRRVDGDEMITLACISIDPYTGELTYSCAGHPPPILVDSDSGLVVRLDRASAPPLGVAEAADVVEARLQLSPRAVLALYTDGLIERRGEDLGVGIDELARTLRAADGATADQVVAELAGSIGEPDDDVAVLLLDYEAARVQFEVVAPADPAELPQMRRRLRTWLMRRGVDGTESADLVLAVSEACNNAIEHAYRDREGTVRLSVEDDDDILRVVVEDNGTWREGPSSESRGRGIALMKKLVHYAQHETGRNGTRVTLERLRPRDRRPA